MKAYGRDGEADEADEANDEGENTKVIVKLGRTRKN